MYQQRKVQANMVWAFRLFHHVFWIYSYYQNKP